MEPARLPGCLPHPRSGCHPCLPQSFTHLPESCTHSVKASSSESQPGGQVPRRSGKSSWGPRCGHDLHGWDQAGTWPGESLLQDSPSRLIHSAAWMQTSWSLWAYELKGPAPLGLYPLSVDGWQFQGYELLATSPGCPFVRAHSSCEETHLNSKLNFKVWRRAGEAQSGI